MSGKVVELVIPMPPSVNAMYRNYQGRSIKSQAYRDWQKLATASYDGNASPSPNASSSGSFIRGSYEFGAVPVSVTIELQNNTLRNYDADNRIKAVLDWLESVHIIVDDCCVDELIVRKLPKGDEALAFVKVKAIE